MKLYMFRTVRLSIIRGLWNILVLYESCLQNCTTYTIAECTVNKPLMMDRELSETYRVSCQNKFVKLVHLVGFIITKFVTKHGHINVIKKQVLCTITAQAAELSRVMFLSRGF